MSWNYDRAAQARRIGFKSSGAMASSHTRREGRRTSFRSLPFLAGVIWEGSSVMKSYI